MQKKLKSIFRRSIGKAPESSQGAHTSNGHTKPTLPHVNDQPKSPYSRGHTAVTVANGGTQSLGARRPASPNHGPSAVQPSAVGNVSDASQSDSDYNAHSHAQNQHTKSSGGQQLVNVGSGGNNQEIINGNVAPQNVLIDANKKEATSTDKIRSQQSGEVPIGSERRNPDGFPQASYTDDDSFASARGSVSSSYYGETSSLPNGSRQSERPTSEINKGNPKTLASNHEAPRLSLEENDIQGGPVKFKSATKDGHEESELHKQLRLDGVVDLTDTVDTDGDITWAPAVTREIVKPHQHEIIQHKIFREIHNYEYFHRIQPVMMTEVLPPRHWIPNPDGEGLMEISADELPARTGENRWWSVIQHESPYSAQKTQIKWRTEPEIIERGMTTTKEGFERRETIIIHPPTLASLKDYKGPVQPVHFDHKTGKRWLGEMSTMEELQDLQKLLDSAPEAHAFQLNELNESLPKMSPSTMPKRKSVPREVRMSAGDAP